MDKQYFFTQRKARIFFEGNAQTAKYQWLCLHGYGQLANFFLQSIAQQLNLNQHYLVAPEAPHRFYLNGNFGRVGASWMTKEERLTDIEDNLNYLQNVYQQFIEPNKSQWVCFSFSQGTATLLRWLNTLEKKPEIVFIWAGSFADEIDYTQFALKFSNTKFIYAVGNEDEFATNDNFNKTLKVLNAFSPNLKRINFEGKHKIYPDVLHTEVNTWT